MKVYIRINNILKSGQWGYEADTSYLKKITN